MKSRIQSKVKKIEKFFNSIEFSKKENDNSLMTRLSSIINIIKITKELENNFKFAEILYLSSYSPIKKQDKIPKKKEKNCLESEKYISEYKNKLLSKLIILIIIKLYINIRPPKSATGFF